jgi:cell division protein FtsI/penicillin-binding protein 2
MRALLEQNGKPCCINLITEADNKFLANLNKLEAGEVKPHVQSTEHMSEEEKVKHEAEQAEALARSMEDEVDVLIRKEEEEFHRVQQADAKKKEIEAKESKERSAKEAVTNAKMEKIKQQERDLLDTRSQPIRQYLMDNVVPHLTEGLIELCKKVPEDSIDYLANFLLERADLLDDLLIKKREEEIRLKEEAKRKAQAALL